VLCSIFRVLFSFRPGWAENSMRHEIEARKKTDSQVGTIAQEID